ncbi:hypothetical protein [Bacillus sp. ISL-34]|nr:hypothetical protein [Bacillus sp. ISL-34]
MKKRVHRRINKGKDSAQVDFIDTKIMSLKEQLQQFHERQII